MTAFPPRPLLNSLEQTLAHPRFCLVAESAWRAFTAQAGPVGPRDDFYLLWAALDFEAQPSVAERLLAGSEVPLALRRELTPLIGSSARVFACERVGTGRQLVDVLDGTPWRSALGAVVPSGALIYTRLAGQPSAPWPVGPVAVFPASARDVLCSWLLDRFCRARGSGQAADAGGFYRQVAPALYRWWRLQRDASSRARVA